MKRTAISGSLVLVSLLAACSSSYQGNYTDSEISPGTYLVTFFNNGFTASKRIDDFLLLRCAQLTLQNGGSYFMVVDKYKQDVSPEGFANPGVPQPYHIPVSPGTSRLIIMLRERPKSVPPQFKGDLIYNARDEFDKLTTKYKLNLSSPNY